MAIAEAEPKKSEVAVTSTGASQCVKPLDSIKLFSETDGIASSSFRNAVKTYDLYSNVRDFTFYMPDGWNDQDIGIFIELCRVHIGGLKDLSMDENSKWQEIVNAGAKMSMNPTLFTINSCMEVAQCIRQYVSRNLDKKKNEAFQRFCEDVKTLLIYFPPSTGEGRRRRRGTGRVLDIKECERVFSDDSDEEQALAAAIYKHIPAFKTGDPGVWEDIADEVDEKTHYDVDVKEFLEVLKTNSISDIYEGRDAEARIEAFNLIRPYLLEIFDYISPRCVTKRDIMKLVFGAVKAEENITSTNKEDSITSRKRRPSPSKFSETTDGVSSVESEFESQEITKETTEAGEYSSLPAKRRRGRPRKASKNETETTSGQPSLEPSSTTLLDELILPDSPLSQHQSISSENIDEIMQSDDCHQQPGQTEESVLPTKAKVDRWKRIRPLPTRILPSREARNKVSSSITAKKEKSQIAQRKLNHLSNAIHISESVADAEREAAKRSPNFRGFEDTDSDIASEEETSRKLRVVRKVTTTRTVTRTTHTNPDTTTNDLDEHELVSSSPRNSTDDDLSYVRRLTRQTKESVIKENFVTEEKVENKVMTFVQADSTLNPVVKLHIMKESDLQKGLRKKAPNRYLSGADEEKDLTFSVPSAKPNIPVESAVLGKDVIKTVYNPNTDSAKTQAGPGSPTSNRRSGSRGRRGAAHVAPRTRKGLKSAIAHYNYSSDSDEHQRSRGGKSNLPGECTSTVVCPIHKTRRMVSVTESSTSAQPSGSTQGENSKSSVVLEGSTISTIAPQIAGLHQPSTSKSNRRVAVRNMLQNNNNQELSLANFNAERFIELHHSKPMWYDDFREDFRKHQVWQMQQMVRMQQELMDIETQKVNLLKEIANRLD